ncbi:MAG TPA: fumarylacetoacetase [Candidatus Dormibacteraeota bacterium]|jgi:fumarylacetoacetase|nr:fumarylacetoacetase [Candidatus Dormibacteraeota bacterium]
MTTWVELPPGTQRGIENLPYAVFAQGQAAPRVGVGIGDHVLDLARALGDDVFAQPSLNAFMARGRGGWQDARARIVDLLTDPGRRTTVEPALLPLSEITLQLPFDVADYVDFYSSMHHAQNVGRIFRPDQEPLQPNWRHLPVGYHGRAGTVVVSGTPITRPQGQRRGGADGAPEFGPSQKLDIEAEVGFVVGVGSDHWRSVETRAFEDHVFGVVLVNDWSARDLQAWETVPLGPFLGKSFATSISAWVVPLAALDAAHVAAPRQDPAPLPYLGGDHLYGLDIDLDVSINGRPLSHPRFAGMYWTPAQQLAHMTVNGASVRTGDLYASGTVSGEAREEWGSLLEITWNGRDPVELGDGSSRTFLEDGDTVIISASAPGPDGTRIGFGEVSGTIRPAATD